MRQLFGMVIAVALIAFTAIVRPGASPPPSSPEAPAAEVAHGADAAHGAAHAHEHWSIFVELVPEHIQLQIREAVGPTLMGEKLPTISHIFFGLVVLLIGVLLIVAAHRRLKRESDFLLPPKKWGALAFFDVLIDALLGLMEQLMSREKALKFLPLMAGFATFILISNCMGLIPGLLPATDSLKTTFALGGVSFLYYNYWGIRAQGIGPYLKHLCGPLLVLAPLMLAIELISHFVRPCSLAIRLMGNMFGDHQVLASFLAFGLPLVPIPIMALGLLVCVVQTLVFTLLSIVYLAMAIEVHEHEEHEHGAAQPAH